MVAPWCVGHSVSVAHDMRDVLGAAPGATAPLYIPYMYDSMVLAELSKSRAIGV